MTLIWTDTKTPNSASIRKKGNDHKKPVITLNCERTVISVSVRSMLPGKRRRILAMARCNEQLVVGRAL